jgi:hypothetical protein
LLAIRNILLILELTVGFGLLLYHWFLGVFIGPWIAGNLLYGKIEAILLLAPIILGAIGLWGMLQLSIKVLNPTIKVTTPGKLKASIASGFVAVLISLFVFDLMSGTSNLSRIVQLAILPLLVATHFLYLGKDYLWQEYLGPE